MSTLLPAYPARFIRCRQVVSYWLFCFLGGQPSIPVWPGPAHESCLGRHRPSFETVRNAICGRWRRSRTYPVNNRAVINVAAVRPLCRWEVMPHLSCVSSAPYLNLHVLHVQILLNNLGVSRIIQTSRPIPLGSPSRYLLSCSNFGNRPCSRKCIDIKGTRHLMKLLVVFWREE